MVISATATFIVGTIIAILLIILIIIIFIGLFKHQSNKLDTIKECIDSVRDNPIIPNLLEEVADNLSDNPILPSLLQDITKNTNTREILLYQSCTHDNQKSDGSIREYTLLNHATNGTYRIEIDIDIDIPTTPIVDVDKTINIFNTNQLVNTSIENATNNILKFEHTIEIITNTDITTGEFSIGKDLIVKSIRYKVYRIIINGN